MADPINTQNTHVVGISHNGVVIMNPPAGPISFDQALLFAAWIVAVADGQGNYTFAEYLSAVQNT